MNEIAEGLVHRPRVTPGHVLLPLRRATRIAFLILLVGLVGCQQNSKRQVVDEPPAFNEALRALRGLRSVTTADITYREYAPRVLDAKVQVDRYLEAEGGDPEIKMNVHQAMALHVFASSAWNAHIARNYEAVADHPALDFCPPVKALRDKKVELTPEEQILRLRGVTLSPKKEKGIAVVSSIPLLWKCASDKIAEIGRLRKEGS